MTSRSLFSRCVAVSNMALCCVHSFAGADDVAMSCLQLAMSGCAVLIVGSGQVFCMVVCREASRSWQIVDYM